ncbi:MAG: response regulator [Verrucomicrobia bacterium]|nr:response regulator [Verrucomicrobiota bacterium]MDA0724821.1 response regulator [Verrucomicrobiota bacterium]MDA1048765.1 response regulator [Verrucomicrobiota bacterium]
MNRKILCVDDDESILKGMHLHLSREFDLSTATSGDEGLKTFEQDGPFAVVVGDMRMPGMDGAEMLKRMKDVDPKVKSILLTGHADFEVGGADLLQSGQLFRIFTKPCSPPKLKSAIERGIHEYNTPDEEPEQEVHY